MQLSLIGLALPCLLQLFLELAQLLALLLDLALSLIEASL